jgi:hypothetical protein
VVPGESMATTDPLVARKHCSRSGWRSSPRRGRTTPTRLERRGVGANATFPERAQPRMSNCASAGR